MLKVLKAGFFTTIQDKGRSGFGSIGVPISGVMDKYSADLANTILNNSLSDAVLEITLGGCKFKFLSDTIICISGGDFSPTINDKLIQLNSKIRVYKNDVLSFGRVNFGARCYLAVLGGIQSDLKMKSRSYFKKITKNTFCKKDDLIPIKPLNVLFLESNAVIKVSQNHFNALFIECLKAPEFNLLSESQKKKLTSNKFSISKENNRMGYRLNEVLENNLPQLLTSSVLPGTVQLTPSGKLIVLMKDCQVTGGYPRVLQLTENSIHRLSQKRTGHQLQFKLKS